MKVKVWKVSQNESKYRTPLSDLDGLPQVPVVGQSLIISSSTHESGGIITSPVESFKEVDGVYIVKTENSTYRIERV